MRNCNALPRWGGYGLLYDDCSRYILIKNGLYIYEGPYFGDIINLWNRM